MENSRRGKKEKNIRNFRAYEEWMKKKKEGRLKQRWVPEQDILSPIKHHTHFEVAIILGKMIGHWEKFEGYLEKFETQS